ncbi:hypothetical protein [Photobacterium sp. Hal280]|uniref:hypothetical protein n=1 Tax=Photobacterium sp. Hal280 TaxID=3035163 RepID=UPI00301DEA07
MTGIGRSVRSQWALLALVPVCITAPATHAAWRTSASAGLHDTRVAEADSDTLGVNLGLGLFYDGAANLSGQTGIIA